MVIAPLERLNAAGSAPTCMRRRCKLALAEKLHDSANKVETHNAQRGQNKRPGREEVEYVTHAGLWAKKTPPPGERPGLPPEPGPQRSDLSLWRSSGEAPLLEVASLAAAAANGCHALLRYALRAGRHEERGGSKKRKRAERDHRRQQAFWDRLAESERQRTSQKQRKKEKMKLPRSSSFTRAARPWKIWTFSYEPFRSGSPCSVSVCRLCLLG